ncbi:hypothetical protein ACIQPP_36360 [Streptomyces violaceusniger]|uniref:hypothetical protein n=1 Tax=Streptomyces violaceusniger TaxID=68280 RepID=UPI0009C1AF9C|nr:hypothetical protein [Streptomyces hygroscopicus]AQW51142.1 carboxymethylenebutenolidase [Streptomyces hygroscopicus]
MPPPEPSESTATVRSRPGYGLLPKRLDQALTGACPVVASYGGRDRILAADAWRRIETFFDTHLKHNDQHDNPKKVKS